MNKTIHQWIISKDSLLNAILDKDKKKIIRDERIKSIINELMNWPGTVLNSHKSAKQSFHKLEFLADIGLTYKDIPEIISKIKGNVSEEGPFVLPMNISENYGGTGTDTLAWAICDAPSITYSMAIMGLKNDNAVIKSLRYLAALIDNNGYRCKVSKELNPFRGPGRKDDPCPYATLIMLRLLNLYGDEFKKEIEICSECLLRLWVMSREEHPYMFYMGTDFRKLKAPLFWYDILNVVYILSGNKKTCKDKRFISMLNEIYSKSYPDGKYKAESIYMSWKGWDFSEKKEPSAWITYYVEKIKERIEM
ncbi:hypothetical protein HY745_06545 [Candidatus Desantisbacteria bacterium]|nr:hypothetical protein [Candidatus Desantisbacteria bacterium]